MNNKENRFENPYILMILALISCFLWGSAFPSIKVGYELFSIAGHDTYEKILFAGYRFFISSIMIFLFSLTRSKTLKLKKGQMPKVAFLGLIQTAIQYTFFYIGLSNTSGTIGSILAASSTFFAVLMAHFFYEEDRLNTKRVTGVVLGFLGVILANVGDRGVDAGFTFTGEGFVLISSLIGAISGIYTKKIAKDISPFAVSGYQLFFGSLLLIILGLMGGGQGITFTSKGFILLLYLGFISAAAFSIWTVLLKYNGVGKVSVYKFTIPIFGTFLSFIFLDESFTGPYVIISILLVSIGIILINKEPSSKVVP